MGEAKRKRDAGFLREVTREQAVEACAVQLAFMLLLMESSRNDHWWAYCQRESTKYPHGSFRNVFWWSLRTMGDGHSLDEFFEYFHWKWREFEPTGHIRRDGPTW